MNATAEKMKTEIRKFSWDTLEKEVFGANVAIQRIFGENATLARYFAKSGDMAAGHSHESEEYIWVTSGSLKYVFDDREVTLQPNDVLVVPPHMQHSVVALEDSVCVGFFTPTRKDWLRGEDEYLRK